MYQRRYDPFDVTVGVVLGSGGLLLVDTRSSHREADELRDDLAAFGAPVRWVVNTHAHFDHAFGNARFAAGSDVGAPVFGHRLVPQHLAEHEAPMLAAWLTNGDGPVEGLSEVRITPPDTLVDDRAVVELGDRQVDLLHLGRGHTDNDLVVHVPDASAWLVGDLLEQSGPPAYGDDSFPLEWPGTIGELAGRLTPECVLVPGHGEPVDRDFAARQQQDLQRAADLIRELHRDGVPVTEAASVLSDRWPFTGRYLRVALETGYRQLTSN